MSIHARGLAVRRHPCRLPGAVALLVAQALLFGVVPVSAQEGSVPVQPTGLSAEASSHSVTLTWDDSRHAGSGSVPDVPTSLRVDALYRGVVLVEWSDVAGAESFDLQAFKSEWADLPGDGVEVVFWGPGAVVSGLSHEQRYYFRVRAGNAFGSSGWSQAVFSPATTTEADAGGAVNSPASGAPAMVGSARVGETLRASVSGISDGDGVSRVWFDYQWVLGQGANGTDIAGATGEDYVVAAPDEGMTLSVRVSFTDRGGYAESLTSAGIVVGPPAVAPGPARNLRVPARDDGELELAWDAPGSDGGSVVTGYRVQWKSGSQDYDPSREASASGLSHTIAGLTDGVEYTVRVVARNRIGEGPASGEVTAAPRDTIPPRLVRAWRHGSRLVLVFDETLSTGAVPGAGAFAVAVGGSGRGVDRVAVEGDAVELELAAAAASGETVTVSYTAPTAAGSPGIEDRWGNAAASFGVTAVAWYGVPDAPRNLTVLRADDRSLALQWDPPASDGGTAVTGYRVQWKSGSQDYDPSREALASGPSHTLRGLDNRVEHTVRVVAVNIAGDSPPSIETAGTPLSGHDRVHMFIERIVEIRGDANPWLRAVWAYMNTGGFEIRLGDAVSHVYVKCGSEDLTREVPFCTATRLTMQGFIATHAVHEMAHVYTSAHGMEADPVPMATGHLYFGSLAPGCRASIHSEELYADVLTLSVYENLPPGYWRNCNPDYDPGEDDPLTDEALAVVRSVLDGAIPQWFTDRYYDRGGNPDLEQLWNDMRPMDEGARTHIHYGLQGAFGGYCNLHAMYVDLYDRYHRPTVEITNPWRDGGCVPAAPALGSITPGAGRLELAWSPPDDDGGTAVEGYVVEWKSGSEDFDRSRQALITDPTELSHTVGGLTGGVPHTLRVAAFNINGYGAYSTEISATPSVEEPPADIWSATLTVGRHRTYSGYSVFTGMGDTSQPRFHLDRTGHTVRVVVVDDAGRLYLGLNREIPAGSVLHLGPASFDSVDASTFRSDFAHLYQWEAPSLHWSAGDSIQARLTEPGPAGRPGGVGTAPHTVPLTARFEDAPETHSPRRQFTFRVVFSEPVAISDSFFGGRNLQATGGRILSAQRVLDRSDLWEVLAVTRAETDLTFTLPSDLPCDEPLAICTPDGKRLSNQPQLTIPSRPR